MSKIVEGQKVIVCNLNREGGRAWNASIACKLDGMIGTVEYIGKATICDERHRYSRGRFLSYTVAMDDPTLGAWHLRSDEFEPLDKK